MFHEFPKALTNQDGAQVLVFDAAEEAAANERGFYFGDRPAPAPKQAPAPAPKPRKGKAAK